MCSILLIFCLIKFALGIFLTCEFGMFFICLCTSLRKHKLKIALMKQKKKAKCMCCFENSTKKNHCSMWCLVTKAIHWLKFKPDLSIHQEWLNKFGRLIWWIWDINIVSDVFSLVTKWMNVIWLLMFPSWLEWMVNKACWFEGALGSADEKYYPA